VLEPGSPPPTAVARPTAARWHGVRVEERRFGAGELQEGSVPGHLLVVNVASPARVESRWSGDPAPVEMVLLPGHFAFYPAGSRRRTSWLDGATTVLVEIAPELVAGRQGPGDGRRAARPLLNHQDPFVLHLAMALRDLALDGRAEAAAYGETLGVVLAGYLAGRHALPALGTPARAAALPGWLVRVVDYVGSHLEREIALHDLAREAGASVFHFAHQFRRQTGLSPHQYVLRRRVERALSLLSDPDRPVGDVALACGFANQSHFSDTFRRVIGLTPTGYRRAIERRDPRTLRE